VSYVDVNTAYTNFMPNNDVYLREEGFRVRTVLDSIFGPKREKLS
jgi:hypothetical protein